MLAGILKHGSSDGIRLNAFAALTAITDRTQHSTTPEGLPIYEIEIDQKSLDKLFKDLPESGDKKKEAILKHEGISYPIKLKTRGNLKLHWGGPKKSIRIYLDDEGPASFHGQRKMNFVNPKTYQLNNNHVSMWLGRQMGVKTVINDLAFLKINGRNIGIFELTEQPSSRYDIELRADSSEMTLFKGDYLDEDDGGSEAVLIWKNPEFWKLIDGEDDDVATEVLSQAIRVVNDSSLTSQEITEQLEEYLDIAAFIRFHACLKILNTYHVDQTHNQVLGFDKKTRKLFPILWDPTYMWPQGDNLFYPYHDPISYHLLQVGKHRFTRDSLLHQFLQDLYHNDRFADHHHHLRKTMAPLVELDHFKCNPTGENMNLVYRFPTLAFHRSMDKILNFSLDYFETLSQEITECSIEKFEKTDSVAELTFVSNAPIRIEITYSEQPESIDSLYQDDNPALIAVDTGTMTYMAYGTVEKSNGETGGPYDKFASWRAGQATVQIPLHGEVHSIKCFNAITQKMVSEY